MGTVCSRSGLFCVVGRVCAELCEDEAEGGEGFRRAVDRGAVAGTNLDQVWEVAELFRVDGLPIGLRVER